MAWTTTELIARLKRYIAVPDGQPAFTDADLLLFLDEALQSEIMPMMKSCREDYFLSQATFSMPADSFTGQNIPSDAVGATIKDLIFYDTSDEEAVVQVARVDAQMIANYASWSGPVWYIRGNKFYILNPDLYSGYTIKIYYYKRHNPLIATDSCAVVSSVASTTVTVASYPAAWTTGTEVDFIEANPHFETLDTEEAITGIVSTDISFAAVPSTLAAGDYLAPTGYTPIAAVPVEVQPLLVQAAACKVLETLGDMEGLQASYGKLNAMKQDVINLISPRAEDNTKAITVCDDFL